jgi:hypothetical protein
MNRMKIQRFIQDVQPSKPSQTITIIGSIFAGMAMKHHRHVELYNSDAPKRT